MHTYAYLCKKHIYIHICVSVYGNTPIHIDTYRRKKHAGSKRTSSRRPCAVSRTSRRWRCAQAIQMARAKGCRRPSIGATSRSAMATMAPRTTSSDRGQPPAPQALSTFMHCIPDVHDTFVYIYIFIYLCIYTHASYEMYLLLRCSHKAFS